ncbi:hypothetical protein PVAND_009642 [Polypedilum vanderplanki]|uniref:Uncharacterized protein n=1 Tax=Polypedilum vanderplanki TaxID=319348 RepID=A0A9J6CDW2_POLVA|nr:hypothetical protein PVAND_009642 [Polypedilum vanderplanki]
MVWVKNKEKFCLAHKLEPLSECRDLMQMFFEQSINQLMSKLSRIECVEYATKLINFPFQRVLFKIKPSSTERINKF